MIKSMKWRWVITLFVVVIGILNVLPNFYDFSKISWLPQKKITLGLDIQGGIHLVMGVDVETVIKERADRMVNNLKDDFKDQLIPFKSIDEIPGENLSIQIQLSDASQADAIKKRLSDFYGTVLFVADENLSGENKRLNLRFYEAYVLQMKKEIVEQAIQVIRNRIDEFGVSEPLIAAQGTDRILVQLPGIKDSASAKDLINRTAKLDFRVVSKEIDAAQLSTMISEAEQAGQYKLGVGALGYQEYIRRLNTDLKAKLPANTRIVFEKLDNAETLEQGRQPFLVRTDSVLGGNQLDDVSVRPDERGRPEVVFKFSVEGRRLFAELTEKAKGGFLAIVLDDIVTSAPTVQERIDSDSARITLGQRDYNTALKEAQLIATALRAGSLPAALTQLEERTVGPSLGTDSIKKGQFATIIGCLIVFAFMLTWYQGMGLVASLTLALNLILTLAGLSMIGATLTLPGVAGLALTIGMAVDANIIIFERIKEEFAKNQNTLAAIRAGYNNAFSAIFDSNITTILTCVILMYYGTGPIRGFAVSLTIGLLISLFTSVFVARTMMESFASQFKFKTSTVRA